VAAGGVIFSTIQKFFPDQKGMEHPLLSNRRNIVVIADEAHRSQYDFIDGFARHLHDALPNASFIGFSGTPIETKKTIKRHEIREWEAKGDKEPYRDELDTEVAMKVVLVGSEQK